MANYLKPQSPLQHKDGDYFYPLTTIDQIITDNDARLSAELISVNLTDAVEGDTNMGINADTLNGKTIEEIKQQIYDEMINYSVVGGTTEPANPTENIIWVNTDQEITKIALSDVKPNSPVEGMIWVQTGNSSGVSFDAFKIANMQFSTVHPLYCKQYIDGSWVEKSSQIYQNGEWLIWWNCYLYLKGNQCEDVTGGWVTNVSTNGTVTYNSDSISVKITDSNNDGATITGPKNPIDLTRFNTISINVTAAESNGSAVCLMIKENVVTNAISPIASIYCNQTGVLTADISALSGLYYIGVGVGWYHPCSITFDEIKLYV